MIVEHLDAELQNAIRDVMDANVRLSAVGTTGCFLVVVPPA